METLSIFGLQLALSLTVVALVANWFVAPWLRQKPAHIALTILLFPHALRHLGLAFLVPGLVGQSLPTYFAYTAAYGDLISGLLALVAIVAVRNQSRFALPLVWLFSIVGTADLTNALVQADAVPHLGSTWYIPTFWVPVLLVTHVMVYARLLSRAPAKAEALVESQKLVEAT